MNGIVAAGFLLRLFYCLFSTIYDRQYDIGMIDLDAGHTVTGGHLAYIQYLYEQGHLPDFDPTSVYQFNHPPLHHAICALWLKAASHFIGDTAVLEESMQIVPLVCSLITLVFMLRIIRMLPVKESGARFAMALLAVHPSLILLSGSINNDGMALMFTVLIVYEAMRFARAEEWRTIVLLALFFGLGLMTKQSVGEMAFPVGILFLYVLWKQAARWKKIIAEYAVFLSIAAPLGLWFYIRNLILWKMPLVWIYTLPDDSWQYTGNVPVLYRFLWPEPQEFLGNLRQFKIGCGYNVWAQIIRTSVLGEWDMADVGRPVKILAVLLMLSGALLAAAALAALIRVFLVRRKEYGVRCDDSLLFLLSYAVTFAFYLKFSYDYPQQCSMNFRYIDILLLFPAAALGCVYGKSGRPAGKLLLKLMLAVFAVLSVAMTVVWCAGT